MNKDDPKLAAALAALSELIKTTIDSGDPGRFAVAARVCKVSHSLAQQTASRVDDFAEQQAEANRGAYYPGVFANPGRVGQGQLWGDGDVMREAVGTLMPMLERFNAVKTERDEAATLDSLLTARDSPALREEHASIIDERITRLITNIEERSKSNAVVPSVILRGHPAGGLGGGLPARAGAADAEGAGGGPTAPTAGAEEALARRALGND